MKKIFNKATLSAIVLVLIVVASECSPTFTSKFHHDKNNPCTPGPNQDNIECENWKKSYPKEYARYQERMKNAAKGS